VAVLLARLAFLLRWLGLRWSLRRRVLGSLVIGLIADALFDALVTLHG
jgi:hypothetical protein